MSVFFLLWLDILYCTLKLSPWIYETIIVSLVFLCNKWSALIIKSGQFYYETHILRYTPLFVFDPVRSKQYLKK